MELSRKRYGRYMRGDLCIFAWLLCLSQAHDELTIIYLNCEIHCLISIFSLNINDVLT